MPIDIARQTTDSPIRRYQNTLAGMNNRRVSDPLAESIGDPDVLGQAWRSFTRDSIVGSAITDFIPYQLGKTALDGEVDPEFDVLKFIDEDYLRANPHLVDPLASGDLFDIPNRERFLWYSARAKEDYDIRQRLGTESLGGSILTALPGQIVDGLVGGLALRGLGLAGKAAQAGEWLKSGSFAARTGKMAFLGSSLNLAQEEALRALNPSRHVDEGQAALWAVGLGAAFGSGSHMLASGKTKLGKWLDPVRAKLISQQVAADLSDPKFHGIDEQAAADAEMLKGELNKISQSPTPNPQQAIIDEIRSNPERFSFHGTGAEEGQSSLAFGLESGGLTTNLDEAASYAGKDGVILVFRQDDLPQNMRGTVEQFYGKDALENPSAYEDINPSTTPISDPIKPVGVIRASEVSSVTQKNSSPTITSPSLSPGLSVGAATPAVDLPRVVKKGAFDLLVHKDRQLVHSLLMNWNDSELTDAGRIRSTDKRGGGGSWRESSNDFIKWLMSDEPFDPKKYDVDAEWRADIERARSIVSEPASVKSAVDSLSYADLRKRAKDLGVLEDGPKTKPALIERVRAAETPKNPPAIPPSPSLPPGLSVGASTPAGTKLREGEIKHFTVLRTPLTEQYIKDVEAFYGKDNVEWGEHPQQYAADAQEVLRKLDEEMNKLIPADLGGVRNAVVKTLGAVTPARKLYDPNLNPSAFSRLVSRVLFDFTTQTQEGFDNPLSGQTFVPAEGLRMVYNGWASEARIGLDEAFREAWQAKATHRMLDGRDVTIGRLSKKDFAEAVQEYVYAVDEAVRGHRPAPEAHPTVAKAAAIVSEYYRKIGMDGKASGYLKDMVDPSRPHFTQQWLTDKIERNAGDFKRRLIAEWEYNRNVDFATGQVMDPEVRTLKMDVVNPENVRKGKNAGGLTDADREAINRYARDNERPLEEVTEMDLRDEFGPEMAQRYEQEVQIYFDKAADSTIESLTRIVSTRHGVLDAMDEIPADVRKGRLLQINPTRFSDYLERDAFRLLESYDHMVSGRIATRMAIKRNAKLIDPFYKELMGNSIAADDYNPGKLIEAINKHFQQYIKDERIPTDVRGRFQKARDVILGEKAGVLTNKLAELEHRAAGSPVGWQLFLDRNLPRMPFMAQMGKVTMAAFNDLASTAFGRRIGNEQVGALGTILRGFVGKPRRDIEGLYVATIDSIRSLRGDDVSDYIPNLERGRFGGGLAGSAMSVADTSLGIAQKGLVAATGINRWSQAMRRTVAGQLLQDIIVGAKKMHAASNLVGQGFTQDKAFAKVGLAIEDARRLNRLGFNAERSKRLLEQIDAHGVDAFGNKVDSTHDGYISPEMNKWWKQDRDLYDTLNAAVNSETLNLIVEPKILSRPLMNNTLLGKLFNQFQGFAMAWGTQLAPLAMQRGGHEIAMYAGLMFGLGAIADALRNELTGRRTLEDTVNRWKENPVGMAYGAIDRSGLTGWLSRPLGMLELTPYGPGKLLKNQGLSSAYGRPGEWVDKFSPVTGWVNKVYSGTVGSLYDGGWNRKNQMLLWRAMPFNNLWAVEGFNRAAERMGFDTPIGPRFQYQGGR